MGTVGEIEKPDDKGEVEDAGTNLDAEDGAAEARSGRIGGAGAAGEVEHGLVLREAGAAPARGGPARRDGGDEGREQVDGAVRGGVVVAPERPPRQQVPQPRRPPRRREQGQREEEGEEGMHETAPRHRSVSVAGRPRGRRDGRSAGSFFFSAAARFLLACLGAELARDRAETRALVPAPFFYAPPGRAA